MTREDIDLQKIQVLESSYQGWFNFKASIITGGIIGFLILFATLKYENLIDFYTMLIGDFLVGLFIIYALVDIHKMHEEHIVFINDLIAKIEKGENLGSISELRIIVSGKQKSLIQKLKTAWRGNRLIMEKGDRVEEKALSTTDDKIDALLTKFTEDQQGRKKERFLSRIDGLYNVLLTLSIFFIGLFISQYALIAVNPLLSFPIIGTIIAMLISFAIGLHGVINDLNEIRIFAWGLMVSCIILIIMIVSLVISIPFLNHLFNQTPITTGIFSIAMIVLNIYLTKTFTRWLEGVFDSKKLEVHAWGKIGLLSLSFVPVFVATISIIIAVIIFLIQFQLL